MNFINSLSLILFSFNIVNFSSSNINDTTNIFNIENNEIYILKDRYFTEDNVNEVNYETYTFNFSLSNITIDVSNELIISFNNEDYLDYINVSSINYDSNLNSYSFDITGINKKENSPLIFTINYLDYTSEEKSKLAGIAAGAQVNVLEGVQVNSVDVALVSGTKKVNIVVPTGALAAKDKVAEGDLESTLADKINNKVDKVAGKGLSTNDYTTEEKGKLAGIEAGAEVNVIETIKVNGTALGVTGTKEVDIAVPTGALASKDKVAETDLEEAVKDKLNAISESGKVSVENIIVPTGTTFVLDGGTASGGAAA